MLISCNQRKHQIDGLNLEYTYLQQDSIINPKIKGLWKSIGNGYILDASEDSIILYSYTRNFCYKERNDYLEGQLNSQSQFARHGDTLNIFLIDYGDKTENLQTKKDFVKLETLPTDCISFGEMQELPPKKLFDLFIETMKENYAFSHERNLDWDLISLDYRDRISDQTTSDELFQLIGEIVTLTKDQHTKIIAEDGRTLQYGVTPSAEFVVDSFNRQSEVDNLDHFFNAYFTHNYKNISDSLLHGKGKRVANNQLEWGSLNEKIGYINIHSFTGFGSDLTREQQIDTISFHMEKAIGALKGKDAVIVDISFNFGGYDAAGLTIAGFFTEKIVDAYTSQVYNDGEFYNEMEVKVIPAGNVSYIKPVYVLMTDVSRSAAESFAMMMDVLPNVKLIGNNTLGTLSGMLGKSISTYYSTSSNQRLLTTEGKYYEVSGVEPDIRLDVFDPKNVFDSHKKAVRQLINLIEQTEKSH